MKRKTISAILIITSILFVNKVKATERISQEELNKSSYSAMQEESKQNEIMLLADYAEESEVLKTWDISATENDNIIATLYSDGKLVISGTGRMKDWNYGGEGSPWYDNKEIIQIVEIQGNVINIGHYTFMDCINLKSVKIEEGVQEIGMQSFDNCINLEKVNFPNTIKLIVYLSFADCKSLERIKLPGSIKSIGQRSFLGCSNLKEVIIEEGLENILFLTFDACPNLKTITLPKSLRKIEDGAFKFTDNLEKVNVYCGSYAEQYVTDNYNVKLNVIHTYEEIITRPTCAQQGYTTHTCSGCNESYIDSYTQALGHSYETRIIAPTKTEQGYTEHTCSKCGESYRDNYVPALGADELIMKINEIENLYKVQLVQGVEYVIVQPGTTKENLRNQIIANGEYEVLNKDKQAKEKDILATNDIVKFKEKEDCEYIIIVKGDIDGNGIIDFLGDIVLLNNYRLGRIKEISVESKLAGDIDENGQTDFINDIVKINNYRIGILHQLNK